jgi:glycosyltransferase involved in cell wall biosynthesis
VQVERLAGDYEIHVYSNRVDDTDMSKLVWRRVPALPGPLVISYAWWFVANHLWRWWDKQFRGIRFDLTYTPGINCLDADVIAVHCVFSELFRQARAGLGLRHNPFSSWGRLLHRKAHYRLIMQLERPLYGRPQSKLTAVSKKTAAELARYTSQPVTVIYHGVDTQRFNASNRLRLRYGSRQSLGLRESDLSVLLVGNGWENKGLKFLLTALGSLRWWDWRLLIVGQDDPGPYRRVIAQYEVGQQVAFLPPRPDVEFYYAAADLYVGPSLEDAFGLPPLEAMACGVPAIVSSQAGVSEIITDGVDGFILADPRDSDKLASLISLLYRDADLRRKMGEAAATKACQYTWDENVRQLDQVFREVLRRKGITTASADSELPAGSPSRTGDARQHA